MTALVQEIFSLFVVWAEQTSNLQIDDESDKVGKLKNNVWVTLVKPHLAELLLNGKIAVLPDITSDDLGSCVELFDVLFSISSFLTYDHRMCFERLVGPTWFVKASIFDNNPRARDCLGSQPISMPPSVATIARGEFIIAPPTTWTLQEGSKVLRKFLLSALQHPSAKAEGFAANYCKFYDHLRTNEVSSEASQTLSHLLTILLHKFLPAYVQQYPSREGAPTSTADITSEEEVRSPEGGAPSEMSSPTPVAGYPNVAICECSLAPTVGSPHEANKNEATNGQGEVTGLQLVEGSLVLNPGLLLKEKTVSSKYALEPFEEVVRVPRRELFFAETSEERCKWTQLVSGTAVVDEAFEAATASVSRRLQESIADKEARLLLSFVFEAKKESAIEQLLSLRGAYNTPSSPKKHFGIHSKAKQVAQCEQSTWSLLLSRCPSAFPTVPSFWGWSDLAFLFGTNVLDETTAKRERLDSVTAAIECAIFDTTAAEGLSTSGISSEKPHDAQLDAIVAEFLSHRFKMLVADGNGEAEELMSSSDSDSDDSSTTGTSTSHSSYTSTTQSSTRSGSNSRLPATHAHKTPEENWDVLCSTATTSYQILRHLFPGLCVYVFDEVLAAPPMGSLSSSADSAAVAELEGKLAHQQALLLTLLKPRCPANFDDIFLNREVANSGDATTNSNHHLPLHSLKIQSHMLSIVLLEELVSNIFSSDHVQWARAVFDSRAFNLNLKGQVQLVLAPVCDMINHSSCWSDILVRRIAGSEPTRENSGSEAAAHEDPNSTDLGSAAAKACYGEGDMIMQLGSGITFGQLREATNARPVKELYMSYGPLQNWELLLSYGFALGDVCPKLPDGKGNVEGLEPASIPVYVGGNPYDRLPLPIDLNGRDEGTTTIDAVYSVRRQVAIDKHFLGVGNGVWISGVQAHEGKPFASVVYPAVLGLLRLYHATIDEFALVESDPFSPCPNPDTEAMVWASLVQTLSAVLAVVGAGTVDTGAADPDDEVVDSDAGEEGIVPTAIETADGTSTSTTTSEDSDEEGVTGGVEEDETDSCNGRQVKGMKATLVTQLRRMQTLNRLISDHHSNNTQVGPSEAELGAEADDDATTAASAVNERLALAVAIPLRQIAIAGIEYCLKHAKEMGTA